MTDEARIARLTELARQVWPDALVSSEGLPDYAGVHIYDAAGQARGMRVSINNHPRALDALEAALLVLASRRYRYSSAPPTEPGWYWMQAPHDHASLRRLRRRTNDAGEVYISDEDGADVARHYDAGVLWAGPIPKPEDPWK